METKTTTVEKAESKPKKIETESVSNVRTEVATAKETDDDSVAAPSSSAHSSEDSCGKNGANATPSTVAVNTEMDKKGRSREPETSMEEPVVPKAVSPMTPSLSSTEDDAALARSLQMQENETNSQEEVWEEVSTKRGKRRGEGVVGSSSESVLERPSETV